MVHGQKFPPSIIIGGGEGNNLEKKKVLFFVSYISKEFVFYIKRIVLTC